MFIYFLGLFSSQVYLAPIAYLVLKFIISLSYLVLMFIYFLGLFSSQF